MAKMAASIERWLDMEVTDTVPLERPAFERAVRALAQSGRIEAIALIRAAFGATVDEAKTILALINR